MRQESNSDKIFLKFYEERGEILEVSLMFIMILTLQLSFPANLWSCSLAIGAPRRSDRNCGAGQSREVIMSQTVGRRLDAHCTWASAPRAPAASNTTVARFVNSNTKCSRCLRLNSLRWCKLSTSVPHAFFNARLRRCSYPMLQECDST